MIRQGKELRGMKQKKSHEVQQICPIIDTIWKESKIDTIVDVGAGQGYISHVSVCRMIQISIWLINTSTMLLVSKRSNL